uniref:Uncharacterized protein n=1 Tax=Arundo donax TaxID=35708 RepID=A0A0A8YQ29_ARUDO
MGVIFPCYNLSY